MSRDEVSGMFCTDDKVRFLANGTVERQILTGGRSHPWRQRQLPMLQEQGAKQDETTLWSIYIFVNVHYLSTVFIINQYLCTRYFGTRSTLIIQATVAGIYNRQFHHCQW